MITFKKNWHYNMLGIYNLNSNGSFSNLLNFIKDNHDKIEGDIIEAGVYRGHSLLSIAKFLKDLGSKKKYMGLTRFLVSLLSITKKINSRGMRSYMMKG